MSVSVIIPTLEAGKQIVPLLKSIESQTRKPDEVWVVDSSSTDGTAELARQCGAKVLGIAREQFDHGGTRDLAFRHTTGDFVLFLTQDVLLDDERYIECLLAPFDDMRVAAVSGRQVAREDARLYVKAVQEYRYPKQSRIWSAEESRALGILAFHLSDVCSAYRRTAYEEVGGFQHGLLTNEDMLIAAALLKAGYRLAYCAEAMVRHSHNLTLRQQYRRNWLVGQFLQRYNEELGLAGELGEGMRMVREIAVKLLRKGHLLECAAFGADCAARFLGNRAGRRLERKREAINSADQGL